jgi:hypothetical protein
MHNTTKLVEAQMLHAKADEDLVLEVVNPTAEVYGSVDSSLAPRPKSLDGLVVGLFWNNKPPADVGLRAVGDAIKARFKNVDLRFYFGQIRCETSVMEQMKAEADVVVASSADCGACTSWLVHDCIQLERAGVATVTIAARGFEMDCEATSAAFGLPDMKYVVVPRVYTALTTEQAHEQTVPVIDEIIRLLTNDNAAAAESALPSVEEKTLNFTGRDVWQVQSSFNDFYLSREWGDGHPLLPPTPERVEALLSQIQAGRDDLVCMMNPGMGRATVEKVAVNCAMAGCTAEEMLVVMAALRAVSKVPPPMDKSVMMSTGAFAPLFVVSGPLAQALKFNGSRCCVGPGKNNQVNIRVGRAIVLCLKNLGRWVPGVMDMDTIGSPRKFIVCLAENEAESPWEPYNVTQGFRPDESTVTVFHTAGEWDFDAWSFDDASELLDKMAFKIPHQGQVPYWTLILGHLKGDEDQRLILMPPDHAIALSEAGYSKQDVQRVLHQKIRLSLRDVKRLHPHPDMRRIRPEWRWIWDLGRQELNEQSMPAFESPECIRIVVAGSHTPKTLAFGVMTAPITEPITPEAGGR